MKERQIVRESSARLNSRLDSRNGETTSAVWHRIIVAMTNPDFLAILMFCLIGILLALNLMLRFPEFGAVIEQYNQF